MKVLLLSCFSWTWSFIQQLKRWARVYCIIWKVILYWKFLWSSRKSLWHRFDCIYVVFFCDIYDWKCIACGCLKKYFRYLITLGMLMMLKTLLYCSFRFTHFLLHSSRISSSKTRGPIPALINVDFYKFVKFWYTR